MEEAKSIISFNHQHTDIECKPMQPNKLKRHAIKLVLRDAQFLIPPSNILNITSYISIVTILSRFEPHQYVMDKECKDRHYAKLKRLHESFPTNN